MAAKIEDYAGKVTVSDGAWGTELDKLGCPPGFCRESWNVSNPECVAKVAFSYVEAGAQIILTNTFGANRFVLSGHGFEDQVAAFNREGARISKQAAGDRAAVFGSIGPSGKMLLIGEVDEQTLYEVFKEQADALGVVSLPDAQQRTQVHGRATQELRPGDPQYLRPAAEHTKQRTVQRIVRIVPRVAGRLDVGFQIVQVGCNVHCYCDALWPASTVCEVLEASAEVTRSRTLSDIVTRRTFSLRLTAARNASK